MNNSIRFNKKSYLFEIDSTRLRFLNNRKVATCIDFDRLSKLIGCAFNVYIKL